MTDWKVGDKAVVTGDTADWSHGYEPDTQVSLVEHRPFRGTDGWRVVDSTGRDYEVATVDLKPAPGTAVEVVRVVSGTGGAKDAKRARYDQIPTHPLRLLAERYGDGNAKYPTGPGEPDNWRKGFTWSLSYAAMQRHANAFWAGEDIDSETGQPHLVAVAWHAFTLLEWGRHPELVEQFDDRQDAR